VYVLPFGVIKNKVNRVRTLQKLFERLWTSSGDRKTEFVGADAEDNLMIFESFVRSFAGQHLPQHYSVTASSSSSTKQY